MSSQPEIQRVGQVLTADQDQLLSIRNFGTWLADRAASKSWLSSDICRKARSPSQREIYDEFELQDDELDSDQLEADDAML